MNETMACTILMSLSMLLVAILVTGEESAMAKAPYRPLTKDEERVIVHKGTEAPFSGAYTDHVAVGMYVCRRCREPLYSSQDKFASSCGWPSFDDEIPGAVRREPDTDGHRTEIICARCGGHLGHVFSGEGLTPKDLRHCVNSVSLDFLPSEAATAHRERAVFAGGCFWGVEYYLRRQQGVLSTTVGYTGGHIDNPTYRQVCDKTTGHVEAVEVIFDPSVTTFETLAKLFFQIHDPTQQGGQGPDVGDQYVSVVFTTNDAQRRVTRALVDELKRKGFDVVTRIRPAETFWPAEEYHQDYYEHKGSTPYCHAFQKRF